MTGISGGTAPLRVLHVVGSMQRGGAETMIMNYYRRIDRNKVQFDVVVHTTEPCAYDAELRQLGGRIFACPRYCLLNHGRYLAWWKQFFASHPELDIVHGHMDSTASLYLRQARNAGRVTIAHSHSTNSRSGLVKDTVKYLLRRQLPRQAEYCFACSREAGEWLFGKAAAGRVQLFPNAIDTRQFAYSPERRALWRQKLGLEDRFVVGHVGRFEKVKNHAFLLEIFRELYALQPRALLLLLGDGELRPEIENKVAALGFQSAVRFAGVQPNVYDWLSAMDIFLLPSLYEGFPVVCVEAQTAGLHCIVSDLIPRAVDVTGLVEFVDLRTHPRLWAEKCHVDKVRKSYADSIRAAGYDIADNAAWLEAFYQKAAHKRRRG